MKNVNGQRNSLTKIQSEVDELYSKSRIPWMLIVIVVGVIFMIAMVVLMNNDADHLSANVKGALVGTSSKSTGIESSSKSVVGVRMKEVSENAEWKEVAENAEWIRYLTSNDADSVIMRKRSPSASYIARINTCCGLKFGESYCEQMMKYKPFRGFAKYDALTCGTDDDILYGIHFEEDFATYTVDELLKERDAIVKIFENLGLKRFDGFGAKDTFIKGVYSARVFSNDNVGVRVMLHYQDLGCKMLSVTIINKIVLKKYSRSIPVDGSAGADAFGT